MCVCVYIKFSLILSSNHPYVLLFYPLYEWENWGTGSLNDFLKSTHPPY